MRSTRGLIAKLSLWILVMYLVVQCGIFVYKLENRSVAEIESLPNERTNKLPILFQNRAQAPLNNCSIPDDWLYPLCNYKIEWMTQMWSIDRECYVNQHGVDPRDNCNMLIYFSEVEKWCPMLPWRRHLYPSKKNSNKLVWKFNNIFFQPYTQLPLIPWPLHVRDDLTELMQKLYESKYQFMRDRIARLWPEWRDSAKRLEQQKPSFGNRQIKNKIIGIEKVGASHATSGAKTKAFSILL
ncbi:alpha-1,6-mannosylglycoprotein 6-beta-N-acetylglucosaminyltransferase B-like [Porites lutea]|uniref:alpha-1,6-mannosylglycoprotein 6-beta-N-acetylglucosaminyltransferase B-like n=1 Tax=Porites lutea TaxID=51062 RepID=UPI003CC6D256